MTDGNSLVEAQIRALLTRSGITKIEKGIDSMMKEISKNLLNSLLLKEELRGIDLSVKQIQKYRYSFNQLMEMSYNTISIPILKNDSVYTFLCGACEFYVVESIEGGSLIQLVFFRNK